MPDDRFRDSAADFAEYTDYKKRLAAEMPLLEAIIAATGARTALDVGCGPGVHAAALAKLGLSVVATDINPEMVTLAERELAPYPDARAVEAPLGAMRPALIDAEALPASDPAVAGFELILVLGNTLCLLDGAAAMRAALEELRGLLAPGGRLLVHVLNYPLLASRPDARFAPIASVSDGARETIRLKVFDVGDPAWRLSFITLSRRRDAPLDVCIEGVSASPLVALAPSEVRRLADDAGFAVDQHLAKVTTGAFDATRDLSHTLVLTHAT